MQIAELGETEREWKQLWCREANLCLEKLMNIEKGAFGFFTLSFLSKNKHGIKALSKL